MRTKPSEIARFTYACRAGTAGDYAGNLDAISWYLSNSSTQTHAAGTKQPNAWGLYDMHGNVREWCQDQYYNYNGMFPRALSVGEKDYPAVRGGSWLDSAYFSRSANREWEVLNSRHYIIGFRLVAVSRTQ